MNMRRAPNRSPSDPPTSRRVPSVSRYASTTHCWRASPPPRSRWIAGRATLTTLPSTKTMLEPRMHAIRTSRLRDDCARCSILADRRRLAMTDVGAEAHVGSTESGTTAYQVVNLDEVEDWLGDYPGEMRGITYAIGCEQVALTHRRMPQHTGSKGSYGHRHKTQEELYFVLSGKLQFKLGDDLVELGKHQAIRIPPQTWRGVWNDEPEDAELIIVSKRIDDPHGDTERSPEDFWPA
jgi:mannose-6-phosphate isomerase-like protein (cupin superfamily)